MPCEETEIISDSVVSDSVWVYVHANDSSSVKQKLIENGNSILNDRDEWRRSILQACVLNNQVEYVKWILEYCKPTQDQLSFENNRGATARDMAHENGHSDIIALLDNYIE